MEYVHAFVYAPKNCSDLPSDARIAHSLECNISADGNNSWEASRKLAVLLQGRLEYADREKINPYTLSNSFDHFLEEFKKCTSRGGEPKQMKDIPIKEGLSLRVCDLSS